MTVITYSADECRRLAAFLTENPSRPLSEAELRLIAALAGSGAIPIPDGARLHIELEPIEESAR